MKRASLVIYLGILLVSLGLAYLTWVEEPKKPGGSVPVLRCKKGDILKLTYEAEDRTDSGIYLPESAKERPMRGKVVATGPGKLLDTGKRGEIGVSLGDEVFYGKYSGTEIEFGPDKYVVLRENDILAVVDK